MLSDTPNTGVRCGVYAVGYFDLSGQSNELVPYIDVNSVSSDTSNIQRDFARIATRLRDFRRDIVKFFEGVREVHLADSAPADAPSEAIAMAGEADSAEIKLQGFSDTVVIYLPLATSPGKVSLYKLAALLVSAANTMLMTFARGSVVRGAIDATWAMEPFDGEIYGPALLSTYKLECEAGWPRVVLGPSIQSIWKTHCYQRIDTHLTKMNKVFAGLQMGMAFRDTDGKIAVDYLGELMRSIMRDSLEPGLIDAAHVGLETELRKRAGDTKIEGKLRSALAYFESRVGPLTKERRQTAAELMQRNRPTNP